MKRVKKLKKKESLKRTQLEKVATHLVGQLMTLIQAGIDYEFEGYSAQADSKRAKRMKFKEDDE